MIYILRTSLLFATLFAFGCSGGSEAPYAEPTEPQGLLEKIRGPEIEPSVLPARTPQWIAALQSPTLEVTLERSGQVALLSPFSDRLDSSVGAVRIWRAEDESQIVLRDGVLIATRGLGHDIGSTSSKTMIAALSAREPLQGLYQLYLVTGDNGTEVLNLMCRTDEVGPEIVDIGALGYETRHVRANCASGFGDITFDFWVSQQGQTVWQSRQWAGPELGYMRLRLLKE